MTEPSRTALPWVDVWPAGARERSKLPPAPPLWAVWGEMHGLPYLIAVGVPGRNLPDPPPAACIQVVDEQGRSQ